MAFRLGGVTQHNSQRLVSTRSRVVVQAQRTKGSHAGNLASLAALIPLAQALPARADEEVVVDSAIDSVVGVVKAAGSVVKASLSAIDAGVQIAKEGYSIVAPVVKQGVDAASPYVSQAFDAAAPALKAALPVLKSTTQEVTKALESNGVPLKVVGGVATDAQSVATPYLSKAVGFATSTDPLLLGEYAVGAVALYLLAPPLLGLFAGSFRGFAGELSAVSALDVLTNDSSALLIDIRSDKEKESGVADVPASVVSRVVEVEYAVTEDRRLRGLLRDPTGTEAQITALQIAALKRAGGGAKIILLDRYGNQARVVARELAKKGFGKVFVISGGFDGNNGWVKSKLQIKPSTAVSSGTGLFGTVSTRTNRKALPAPRSA